MDIKQAAEWISLLTGLFAVTGGMFALTTYRRTLRLNRAIWMEKLHSKFYETQNYKRIRRILDYQCSPDYENLWCAINNTMQEDELCECFVDYLNFFEYIASLWQLGQLSQLEILMLFEYYLRLMKDQELIWNFIREHSFENLELLLTELPARKTKVAK